MFEEVKETLKIVFFTEIDRHPMSNAFIVGCELHWLFQEGLDWDVVEVCFSLTNVSCAGDFGDLEAQTELILFVVQFSVETNEFFSDKIILVL